MEIHLSPEEILKVGIFIFTNTLLISVIGILILLFFSRRAARKMDMVPRGGQNFFEALIELILGFMESVTQSRDLALKFFPLVSTIFIFVAFSNWIEIVPGLGSVFVRSPSSDLNFTLAIAIISVIGIQYYGIRETGFLKYGKKFINFENPIKFFIGILELLSEFAKIISFSFRLFGNIFAGEVLLLVMYFALPFIKKFPIIAPLPFLFLEVFVGFIQALVFSMLTLVFLKIATEEHEH